MRGRISEPSHCVPRGRDCGLLKAIDQTTKSWSDWLGAAGVTSVRRVQAPPSRRWERIVADAEVIRKPFSASSRGPETGFEETGRIGTGKS